MKRSIVTCVEFENGAPINAGKALAESIVVGFKNRQRGR